MESRERGPHASADARVGRAAGRFGAFALGLALACAASLGTGTARAASATDSVIGGDAAFGGQWPSVVALVREGFFSAADRQFCGATAIAPRWALTAAHCLYDAFDRLLEPGSMRVVESVTDLRAEPVTEETVVTNVFVHPAYDHLSQDAYHDIALLELGSALEAPPVTLFRGDPETLGESPGVVVGWGATEFSSAREAVYPDALHYAMVPLVPRALCNAPQSYDGYVGEGQLCAGFEQGGVDGCVGDSGGPLFVDTGDGIEQVGVVSYGRGCAEPRYYGIYSNVSAYLGWIAEYVELPGIVPAGTLPEVPPRRPTSAGTPTPVAPDGPVLRPIDDLTETSVSGGGGGGFGVATFTLLGLGGLVARGERSARRRR